MSGLSFQDSEELIQCAASIEQLNSLREQDDYGGRTASKELGLGVHLERAIEREDAVRARLRVLGRRLDWPGRAIGGGRLPSVSWLARATGQQKLYKFLYHATSRFVHFSAAELLRRAWGRPGSISVRSIHFQDYWAAFALYWGLRLFLDSAITLCETPGMPEEGVNETDLLSAARGIAAFGQVPIITAEELAWPE